MVNSKIASRPHQAYPDAIILHLLLDLFFKIPWKIDLDAVDLRDDDHEQLEAVLQGKPNEALAIFTANHIVDDGEDDEHNVYPDVDDLAESFDRLKDDGMKKYLVDLKEDVHKQMVEALD